MKAMGDASKTIVEMLKGKIGYDSAKLADQAKLINDHSKELLHYFPEGSHQKPSEALPAIWQNWDDFKQRNQALETESAKLLEVAEQEDKKAISKQFAAVGKTCTGCHQDYRQKKKK